MLLESYKNLNSIVHIESRGKRSVQQNDNLELHTLLLESYNPYLEFHDSY